MEWDLQARQPAGGVNTDVMTCVLTSPRRGVDYLARTLLSAEQAELKPLKVHVDDPPTGCNAGYKAAMRRALDAGSQSRILILQDDVQLARGLGAWLSRLAWPEPPENIGCLSLYCATPYTQPDVGWWRFPLVDEQTSWSRVYGALAFLWPRESAEAFLAAKPAFDGMDKVDQLIGAWCAKAGKSLWVHSPSLVQHIGKVSTKGMRNSLTPERLAASFVSEVSQLESRA